MLIVNVVMLPLLSVCDKPGGRSADAALHELL